MPPPARTATPAAVLRALRLFFGLTVACLAVELVCRFGLHLGFPYDWPLPPRDQTFFDFLAFESRFGAFHTAGFADAAVGYPFTYPPGCAPLFAFFFALPSPVTGWMAAIVSGFGVAGVFAFRALRKEGLSLASSLGVPLAFAVSYPLWFELQQANSEFFVWICMTVGLAAVLRKRPTVAAVCFCVAASMKLYPIVLLAPLLKEKKAVRAVLVGALTAGALTLAGLVAETGSIAVSLRALQLGMAYFRDRFLILLTPNYDHSLFAVVKVLMLAAAAAVHHHVGKLQPGTILWAQTIYLLGFGALGLGMYFRSWRRLPVLNQIILLCGVCVLLPPVSYDYTLIQLYFPCLLLMLAAIRHARAHGGTVAPGTQTMLLLFAFLFAPEGEFIVHGLRLGALLKCAALVALLRVAVRHPVELAGTSGE